MFLVIGMPGEKLDDMWTSIRFAAYCRCYSPHISVATPYPGTKLFEECMQKGYFVHEFTLDDLFIRSFIIRTPEWDEHDMRRILLKAYIYLTIRSMMDNPFMVLKRIIEKLKNPLSVLKYLKRTV
jgi:radical SAM superfamily enzyme YgiQ (UPF0313 family)